MARKKEKMKEKKAEKNPPQERKNGKNRPKKTVNNREGMWFENLERR